MKNIRLVQINQNGQPDEEIADLDETAKQACSSTSALYRATSFVPPWVGYLALHGDNVVGTCAFNTINFKLPALNGKAEIAYFTFTEFEGNGFATAMAKSLIEIARAVYSHLIIVAQTAPQENSSNYILKKLGFAFSGPVQSPEDGEIWEWHLAGHAQECIPADKPEQD